MSWVSHICLQAAPRKKTVGAARNRQGFLANLGLYGNSVGTRDAKFHGIATFLSC